MKDLQTEFDEELHQLYKKIKKEVYNPTVFKSMFGQLGGLECAKKLLSEIKIHSGFTRLVEENRLELTVEAFVYDRPQYHTLFTSTMLDNARMKLDQLGYFKRK